MPQYEITKGKIAVGSTSPAAVLNTIANTYSTKARVNADDGVKLDFEDSWVHLRASNTEPIIRIIAEAHTQQHSSDLVQSFTKELQDLTQG